MKRTKKTGVALLSGVMAASLLTGVLCVDNFKLFKTDAEKAFVTSPDGVLRYDPTEFSVTEDYAAFVPAAMWNPSGGISLLDSTGTQKMRLDPGKTGLFIESKQTGDAVEGKGFEFANTMNGDFSMDFRIFSETTEQTNKDYWATVDGNTQAWNNDQVNSALDIRRIGITFRSVTDESKAFTVYIYSGEAYGFNYEAQARVYVEGESWRPSEAPEMLGYGLHKGETGSIPYGYATAMLGTSLSNAVTGYAATESITLKFDVDTMSVFGVSKEYKKDQDSVVSDHNNSVYGNQYLIGGIGATYTETDVLIRNVGTNNTKADNTGSQVPGDGLLTLDKEDFLGGYTTSVTIESMTADNTPLYKLTADAEGDGVYMDMKREVVDADGYARTAKMVIYDVNGQSLAREDEWKVEYYNNATAIAFNTPVGAQSVSGFADQAGYTKAEYNTAVKYGNEAGSTKITTTNAGHPMLVSIDNAVMDTFNRTYTLTLSVFVEDNGSASDYQLRLYEKGWWDLGLVGKLKAGEWTTLTIKNGGLGATRDGGTSPFHNNAGGYFQDWNCQLTDLAFCIEPVDGAWSFDTQDAVYFSGMTYTSANSNKSTPKSIMKFTSTASNVAAEGNSFSLDPADFKNSNGTYQLGMQALSAKYAPKDATQDVHTDSSGATQLNYGDYFTSKTELGLGDNMYEYDPYSDIRELGLTIRSTTNPSKAFTIYLESRSSMRARATARVYVEGEAFRNASGKKGFAQGANGVGMQQGALGGTFGVWGNTFNGKFDDGTSVYAYNSFHDPASYIKFDPNTMSVYGMAYGWTLIRNMTLAGYDGRAVAGRSTISTLSSSDFVDANGNPTFTMEMFVSEMNTEWNKGLTKMWQLEREGTTTAAATGTKISQYYTAFTNWNQTSVATGYSQQSGATGDYVLKEGYDRKCEILIFAKCGTYDQKHDAETAFNTSDDGYEVTWEWTDTSTLKDGLMGGAITLNAPKLVNLFNTTNYVGEATYASKDGTDTGVLNFVDGTATFTPAKVGEYVITVNGVEKTIKVGYEVTVKTGAETNKFVVTTESIALKDYQTAQEGSVFAGWVIEGMNGIYSSEYELDLSKSTVIEAKFMDFAMTQGGSIRMSSETSGLRFRATVPMEQANELLALSGNQVGFKYAITGNMKTIVKDVDFSKIYANTETGNYELYAAIVGLVKEQYAMNFSAKVIAYMTTTDGQYVEVEAIQPADNERCIQEVAAKALASGDEYTDAERKILEQYAALDYAKTLTTRISTNNHVQGVDYANGFVYHSYGPVLIKQNAKTGEVVGSVTNLYPNNSGHGGNCAYYEGKIYITYEYAYTYDAWSNELLSKQNCFIIVVDDEQIVGTKTASEANVKFVYIGAPIVKMSTTAGADETLETGGLFGVTNSIDSISFGPMPGATDGKYYMSLGLGLAGAVTVNSNGEHNYDRPDTAFFPIMQWDISSWTENYFYSWTETLDKLTNGGTFVGPENYDGIWFYEMGCHDFGIQNLEYDPYQHVWLMGCYDYHGNEGYGKYRGFAADAGKVTQKTIPYGNGLVAYVMDDKCGIPDSKGVQGFPYGEVKWGTGVCSMGDGYYYVSLHGTEEVDGVTVANDTLTLYRWKVNPTNVDTVKSPFEEV